MLTVIRLSSAFHYGFLSPMKVAREAAAVGTKAAEKYLDELLIFGEHVASHLQFSPILSCQPTRLGIGLLERAGVMSEQQSFRTQTGIF